MPSANWNHDSFALYTETGSESPVVHCLCYVFLWTMTLMHRAAPCTGTIAAIPAYRKVMNHYVARATFFVQIQVPRSSNGTLYFLRLCSIVTHVIARSCSRITTGWATTFSVSTKQCHSDPLKSKNSSHQLYPDWPPFEFASQAPKGGVDNCAFTKFRRRRLAGPSGRNHIGVAQASIFSLLGVVRHNSDDCLRPARWWTIEWLASHNCGKQMASIP